MRAALLRGVAYSPGRADDLMLHRDICEFDDLLADDRRLDDEIILAINDFLKKRNLELLMLSFCPSPGSVRGSAQRMVKLIVLFF